MEKIQVKKRQRLYFILFVLACLGTAAALSLYALKDNISYFYAPSEVKNFQQQASPRVAVGHRFRLGGLVKQGSLQKRGNDLTVSFIITDTVDEVRVEYSGILPDLFRESQGVIADGSLDDRGVFKAETLLAKHDEKYMPPEVAKSLEKAAREKIK
jgi:cytochrome c-type biogenesis protein CcmE